MSTMIASAVPAEEAVLGAAQLRHRCFQACVAVYVCVCVFSVCMYVYAHERVCRYVAELIATCK
jgi:hypothetical protein